MARGAPGGPHMADRKQTPSPKIFDALRRGGAGEKGRYVGMSISAWLLARRGLARQHVRF